MKSIKKLIGASVLSMMAASCYAGSIIPGSLQQSSVDIGFALPQQLSVKFAPVPNLKAGLVKSNSVIATIAVSSASAKQFAIAADFNAKNVRNGDTWTLYGKNTGKGVTVYFYGETGKPQGNVSYDGHPWVIYNINDKLVVKLAGDQNVAPDLYPMTVNIAAYQA
ncbi:hypothetical protein DQ806_14395 [Salmonella enterica subsp. enterica serovar Okatie]|nr:hypothetical protein [Salmonella enterica subsp. enterica serovar Okatie]